MFIIHKVPSCVEGWDSLAHYNFCNERTVELSFVIESAYNKRDIEIKHREPSSPELCTNPCYNHYTTSTDVLEDLDVIEKY